MLLLRLRLPVFPLVCLLLNNWRLATATTDNPALTFETLLQSGKEAYTMGDWSDCVGFMRRAVEDYRYWRDELLWCREKCQRQVDKPSKKDDDVAEKYFRAQKALCLVRCRSERLTNERPALKSLKKLAEMQSRRPYEYIHICYWRMHDLQMAVQSAFTFLVANPTHQDVLKSLKFYMEQKDFQEEMLVDTMQHDYERSYMRGVEHYAREEWNQCIAEFELSLEKLFTAEKKCRLECEDHIDWSSFEAPDPEATIVWASIESSVLRCAHNCLDDLSRVNGRKIGHFVATHFDYMAFCYFKLQRGIDASASIATQVLFDPENAVARRNRQFYANNYARAELFEPYPKFVDIFKHRELEHRYIDFIDSRFKYDNGELVAERADDRKSMDLDVSIDDTFDYKALETPIITDDECRQLRAPFPTASYGPLLEEVQSRMRKVYASKGIKLEQASCTSDARNSGCDRAIVLSFGTQDCGVYLSANGHSGCALSFCT